VCSCDVAFLAIKYDGSAVAWGHPLAVPHPGIVSGATSFGSYTKCI
jgi:hypothetical protein